MNAQQDIIKDKFYTYCQFIGPYQYIGKGINKRLYDTKNHSRSNEHYSNAVNKYGLTYSVIIQYFRNEEMAYESEKEMIALQKSLGIKLLNKSEGGKGPSRIRTDEHKKNIAKSLKGLSHAETRKQNQSKAKLGNKNPRYGKKFKHKDESIKKMKSNTKEYIKETKWYNNGVFNLRLKNDEVIPEGYKKGRIKFKKKSNGLSGKQWSDERKIKHSKTITNWHSRKQ